MLTQGYRGSRYRIYFSGDGGGSLGRIPFIPELYRLCYDERGVRADLGESMLYPGNSIEFLEGP
jgi:hypothetical protein